jgi:hypothetical protein
MTFTGPFRTDRVIHLIVCQFNRPLFLSLPMLTCSEVNECARAIHDCDSEEVCLDLPYGFTCVTKCSRGYEMTREAVCIGKKLFSH